MNPAPAAGNSLCAHSLQCHSTQGKEILKGKKVVYQKLQFIFTLKLFIDLS